MKRIVFEIDNIEYEVSNDNEVKQYYNRRTDASEKVLADLRRLFSTSYDVDDLPRVRFIFERNKEGGTIFSEFLKTCGYDWNDSGSMSDYVWRPNMEYVLCLYRKSSGGMLTSTVENRIGFNSYRVKRVRVIE